MEYVRFSSTLLLPYRRRFFELGIFVCELLTQPLLMEFFLVLSVRRSLRPVICPSIEPGTCCRRRIGVCGYFVWIFSHLAETP